MNDETRTYIMALAIKLTYVKTEEKIRRTNEQIFNILYDIYPNEDEKSISHIANSAINMHDSFMKSIHEAGGSFNESLEQIFDLTYLELLSRLATNHIRFIYDGTSKSMKERISHLDGT